MKLPGERNLQVDLEQLDVQLGRGTLELRGVLLNCDYLNEQLVSDAGDSLCDTPLPNAMPSLLYSSSSDEPRASSQGG